MRGCIRLGEKITRGEMKQSLRQSENLKQLKMFVNKILMELYYLWEPNNVALPNCCSGEIFETSD